MKSYVITMRNMQESVEAADRCIKSAAKFGVKVEKYWAITPDNDPVKIAAKEGIPTERFAERYSRFERCLSAFLSHYRLWVSCASGTEDFLIFEHDAVVKGDIRDVPFRGVLSYGKPSYGKFVTPPNLGVNKLVSKQYLPGAHAYKIRPSAARQMVTAAREVGAPTDLFINNNNFPFIEEMYPWPVEAHDMFSTIQNTLGCQAKHNNGPQYKVL